MNVLAIETSCDDTCVAIIKASGPPSPRSAGLRRAGKKFTQLNSCKANLTGVNFDILSNIVSSQVEVHRKWGGVYPTLAKREHQKNLAPVLKEALKKARNPKIDLIAVTSGPGLEPCLWVGVNFAKALSYYWDLPIVPVNHIEAHIFANFVGKKSPYGGSPEGRQNFPAICLVVSGGHTQLILMKDFGKYKILGETRDDAAGECFDKVAKILGLDYPGGPAIAAEAKETRSPSADGERVSFKLPRPMIHQKNYDFSFSGLKTAVLYNFKSQTPKTRKSKQYIKEMCYETQQAIIDVLISKTVKAAKAYKVKSIILGGGVASNNELRKQLKETCLKWSFKHLVPPKNLCTDNGAMVGAAGYFHRLKRKSWQKIKADANLKIC